MIRTLAVFFLFIAVLQAQDFTGIRIYVNPGHGGHDPANDRYIPETGFWESEGNLTKGLYLRDLLQAHNATVFISRTQNRDVDDLPLSQIDADANANDVDYFHSIHSNAYNAKNNYPLVLFRGYDDAPVFPDAKRMGSIMFNELNKANKQWTYWGYNFENNRGDWSFYNWGTSGLGVLRYLNMPGTLSEGSFHDYLPNSFRLMSIDYRKHESIVLFRSFVKYFGLTQPDWGVLAGIVRSASENVSYSYNYNSGLPNDRKKALNNARVQLLETNDVYVTDYHNNGFFMFEGLAPGTYTVVMDAGEYSSDTVTVTVSANKTSFANAYLQKVSNKPPEVYLTNPAGGDVLVPTQGPIVVKFSQSMDTQSVEQAFKTQPATNGYFSWENNDRQLIYALYDTLARSTTYLVTIDTVAKNKNGLHLKETYSFEFTTADEHVPPKVVDFGPAMDSVRINTSIYVRFDTPMRKAKTEEAFSINPPVTGHFDWEDDQTGFTFVSDSLLLRKTRYTVTLSRTAENFYGVALDSVLQFEFLTRYRNGLILLNSFPYNNQTNVSTRLQIFAVFSSLPAKYSVFGNFKLADSTGAPLAFRGLSLYEKEGHGVMVFEPREPLKSNRHYTIEFYPGIEDNDHLFLPDTLTITFKTSPKNYGSGKVVDDFETNFGWIDPDNNTITTGTDADATKFDISRLKYISGTYSGKLNYTFSVDSGGVCCLLNEEGLTIPDISSSTFGLWVYGDFSHNILELWFDRGNKVNTIGLVDTLNWAGWKLLTIPIDSIAGQGEIKFHSLVIRQNPDGYHSGTLFIDDVQYDVTFTGIEDGDLGKSVPRRFALHQNFPNPFNPVTTIVYEVPAAGKVELSVFNVLGQKVAQLVNNRQSAGIYQVKFNAAKLSSGIYFYRLKQGKRSKIKKMVVIK